MKYRYVMRSDVAGNKDISRYRLLSKQSLMKCSRYNAEIACRINIPEDLILEKWSCDSYYTTRDARKVKDFRYDIIVWSENKNKWIIHNELKEDLKARDLFFDENVNKIL